MAAPTRLCLKQILAMQRFGFTPTRVNRVKRFHEGILQHDGMTDPRCALRAPRSSGLDGPDHS